MYLFSLKYLLKYHIKKYNVLWATALSQLWEGGEDINFVDCARIKSSNDRSSKNGVCCGPYRKETAYFRHERQCLIFQNRTQFHGPSFKTNIMHSAALARTVIALHCHIHFVTYTDINGLKCTDRHLKTGSTEKGD